MDEGPPIDSDTERRRVLQALLVVIILPHIFFLFVHIMLAFL